jgi:hypothetical protein
VNAHINLDLGAAAAGVCDPQRLPELKPDFDRINQILSGVLVSIQGAVDRHSPLMKVLDAVGGRTDEQFIAFNVREARAEAWDHALLLAAEDPAADQRTLEVLDRKVALLAKLVRHPGPLLRTALDIVRFSESRDVATVIKDLAAA